MNEINQRNFTLDLLKCIFCFLIVLLHSPQFLPNSLFYILRSITAIAVPGFFAVSGYLVFFDRHYTYKSLFQKVILKYFCIFALWFMVYVWLNWSSISDTYVGFLKYAITNSEGWHLWYIKDYIQILIIYPFIKKIIDDKKLLRGYCVLWILLVGFRFVLTIIPWIDWAFIRVIQIPLFQISGYIGGTLAGYYPTEAMGLMIVGGVLIRKFEEVGRRKVSFLISILLFTMGIITAVAMIYYQTNIDPIRFDYALQPFHIYLLMEMCGGTGIIYFLSGRCKSMSFKRIIHFLSRCTMGIYLIHPLVGKYVRIWLSAWEGEGKNFIIFIVMFLASLVIVAIAHWVLPAKIQKWII